jgi:hypothetical protein
LTSKDILAEKTGEKPVQMDRKGPAQTSGGIFIAIVTIGTGKSIRR